MREGRLASAWAIDPISWVTTSAIPATATAIIAVYGTIALLTFDPPGDLLQGIAVVVMLAAGILLHVRTRPPRGLIGVGVATTATVLAITATLLSALAYGGETFAVTLWWAPLGIALLMVAAAPSLRPAAILAIGGVQLVAVAVITVIWVVPDDPTWPPLTMAIITATPVVAGTTLSAVLSGSIVRRLMRWTERPFAVTALGPGGIDERDLVRAVDDEVSEQLAAAVAFLRGVAERGAVDATDADRARALANELRARLLVDAQATWLERVVRGQAVELDDPDRLADRLSVPQRTALRAMMDALLAHPESGFVSARIALRASGAHDVAVALRILTTLPEGRRVTFLAPYYVSLSAAVRDIRWRDGAELEVEFEAPAETTAGRAPLVQRTPRRAGGSEGVGP